MRVVHQLIAYFHSHGALDPLQIEQLRAEGFLPDWMDDKDEQDFSLFEDSSYDKEAEPDTEILPPKFKHDPEQQYYTRSGKPLGVNDLCAKIQEVNYSWSSDYQCLTYIGKALSADATTWNNAVKAIRKADAADVGQIIRQCINKKKFTLSDLSQCLDLNDYRYILTRRNRSTQASGAYRALLRINDFSSLGKYAWILKYQQVNDIFHLIQAKRVILAGLQSSLAQNSEELGRGLRGMAGSNLFWAFVIGRSATLDDPWQESRRKTASRTTYLDKLWPPNRVLRRASLYALFMEPGSVLSFLTSDFNVPEDARGNPPWIIPGDWTTTDEKHYIKFRRRRRGS